MSHFEELSVWESPGATIETLRAVGWLERGWAYSKGEVTEPFFEALLNLLVRPWEPVAAAGPHACSQCRFAGGPAQLTFGGTTITMGVSNVYVPGNAVIYVAPSLVAHYVDAHEYQPPKEFMEAVLQCPPMRSMEYLRAIKSIGGSALIGIGKSLRGP